VYLFGLALPAGASMPAVVETHTPFSDLINPNPCTAEIFLAEGFMHAEDHITVDDDGSTRHHLQASLQDVKGVSASGTRYVVTSATSSVENTDSDFAPFVSTLASTLYFVRLGEDGMPALDDDFSFFSQTELIVNSNGTVSVSRSQTRVDCN
jgi:hypothetical protein